MPNDTVWANARTLPVEGLPRAFPHFGAKPDESRAATEVVQGVVEITPSIPAALELTLYAALMLTVGTARAGVLTVCSWGVS